MKKYLKLFSEQFWLMFKLITKFVIGGILIPTGLIFLGIDLYARVCSVSVNSLVRFLSLLFIITLILAFYVALVFSDKGLRAKDDKVDEGN